MTERSVLLEWSLVLVIIRLNYGINDELKFYFNSLFNFAGELLVFDRWGNQLFQMESNDSAILSWNGTSNREALNSCVYLWIFKYQTNGNNKQRVLSGDVTIIR